MHTQSPARCLCTRRYAGQAQDRSDQSLINKPNLIHFASPVLSVTPAGGDRVFVLQLQRPLAYDLRPDQWSKVEVHKFTSKYVFGVRAPASHCPLLRCWELSSNGKRRGRPQPWV